MSFPPSAKPLVWIHGDCLDPRSPALTAFPEAPRVFVFDEALLEDYGISFKRIVFLYECLLEIEGIEIRRGDVAEELAAAAEETGCSRIVTVESVAPRFRRFVERLRQEKGFSVEVLPLEPFVPLDEEEEAALDLARFSRYWRTVSGRAMRRS
jgi:hypothetical protein